MHGVLVENFAKARETCATGALFCEGEVPKDWAALVATSRAGLAKLPADLKPWYAEQKPFYQGYLYELVRLAGLFPKTTSEILPLSPSEKFGLELPDRSFLLTFDDGPTPQGKGGTDASPRWFAPRASTRPSSCSATTTRPGARGRRWSS